MSVYREGYIIINKLRKLSVQIWEDSCDVGIPVIKNDNLWNTAKKLVEWYGVPETRKESDQGVSIKVCLLDEWAISDNVKTIEDGTDVYQLSYYKFEKRFNPCLIHPNYDGFFAIDKLTK